MTLHAPDGTGIKGGKVDYHTIRMLTGLAILREFPLDSEFTEKLVVYHAKRAGTAALNRIYNGKRPK